MVVYIVTFQNVLYYEQHILFGFCGLCMVFYVCGGVASGFSDSICFVSFCVE